VASHSRLNNVALTLISLTEILIKIAVRDRATRAIVKKISALDFEIFSSGTHASLLNVIGLRCSACT
jgi:hypothetical protein